MNDFLIYAARLQDAGVTTLELALSFDKDRMRIMHVTPGSSVFQEISSQWPTRTFHLDGTDPLLKSLKDDMLYDNDGPTPEMIEKAVVKYPWLREDLNEWLSDYLLHPLSTNEDLEDIEVSTSDVHDMATYAKGLMRGIDITREQEARKST
jgi:hypothetical protein